MHQQGFQVGSIARQLKNVHQKLSPQVQRRIEIHGWKDPQNHGNTDQKRPITYGLIQRWWGKENRKTMSESLRESTSNRTWLT